MAVTARRYRPAVPPERRYRVRDRRYKSGYRVTRWGRRARRKWGFLLSTWAALFLYSVTIHLVILAVLGAVVLLAYGGYRVKIHFFPRRAGRDAIPPGTGMPAGETRVRQPLPREVKAAVWLRDGGRCAHCGVTDADATARTGVHLHYDHIVPFSRNGADTVNNIQLLCEDCNLSKGNRYAG
jgi:HNH endonuclease